MTAQVERTIRVLIGDSEPLFRAGLARLVLQDNRLLLAAELDNGRSALETIRRLEPDVAVLDTGMPGLDGLRVVHAIAREELATRIVLLTANRRPEVAFEAMAGGAHGYLSKRADSEAVRDAIRRVACGGIVLCEQMQTLLAAEIQLRHGDQAGLLTAREHDVLVLIADGLSSTEIGRRLHVAPSTVKGYIARIYARLGVGERAQAVAEAMRRGLLE